MSNTAATVATASGHFYPLPLAFNHSNVWVSMGICGQNGLRRRESWKTKVRGKELEENGFGVVLEKKGEAVTAPP